MAQFNRPLANPHIRETLPMPDRRVRHAVHAGIQPKDSYDQPQEPKLHQVQNLQIKIHKEINIPSFRQSL